MERSFGSESLQMKRLRAKQLMIFGSCDMEQVLKRVKRYQAGRKDEVAVAAWSNVGSWAPLLQSLLSLARSRDRDGNQSKHLDYSRWLVIWSGDAQQAWSTGIKPSSKKINGISISRTAILVHFFIEAGLAMSYFVSTLEKWYKCSVAMKPKSK